MVKIILLLLLLIPSSQMQARSWTEEEQAWAVAALAFTVGDWATTRNMTGRYSQGYYEQNAILGKYPSRGRVDGYFAITIPLVFLILDSLDDYRKPALIGITALEAAMVGHNLHIGLRLQF